jgi:hypothetical protein
MAKPSISFWSKPRMASSADCSLHQDNNNNKQSTERSNEQQKEKKKTKPVESNKAKPLAGASSAVTLSKERKIKIK